MASGYLNHCKECIALFKKTTWSKTVRKCLECSKDFKTLNKNIKRGPYTCSRSCGRLKIIKRENLSPNWKGDKVGKPALHNWVERQLGKPKKCEHCNTETAKCFDWSNISQEYKRDINDWQRLCRKCHSSYDKNVRLIKWKKSVEKLGWKTT